MERQNKFVRKIDVSCLDIFLGTLFEASDGVSYTYLSNIAGEIRARNEYFLPKSYEDSMLGSNGTNIEKKCFIEDIVSKLDRSDLVEKLHITNDDTSFDKLYKLALTGEFVGELFRFDCGKVSTNNNKKSDTERER